MNEMIFRVTAFILIACVGAILALLELLSDALEGNDHDKNTKSTAVDA